MSGLQWLWLILVSMGWFAFLAGLALGLRLLPGVVGSVTVFFTLPLLARHGVHVPWPWLWILLPLAIDPLVALLRTKMRGSRGP
ncbi:MAG TPA: hypothetical protein VF211_15575 [Burkholderiales bacterium]